MAMLGLVAPKTVGEPISNQRTPWVSVAKTRPVPELIIIWLLLSGLTTKLIVPRKGHCASGVLPPLAVWTSPKVRPTPLNGPELRSWKKFVFWPPQQGQ